MLPKSVHILFERLTWLKGLKHDEQDYVFDPVDFKFERLTWLKGLKQEPADEPVVVAVPIWTIDLTEGIKTVILAPSLFSMAMANLNDWPDWRD